jgi:hypothetical protein
VDDGEDWSDEELDAGEAAVRTVGDWLMAEGIVGWQMDGLPKSGEPVELQLYSENRLHAPHIRAHFGDRVFVTILPEHAPRYAPIATPPEALKRSPGSCG